MNWQSFTGGFITGVVTTAVSIGIAVWRTLCIQSKREEEEDDQIIDWTR